MRKILTIATVLASMIPAGFSAPSASAQQARPLPAGPAIPKGAIVVPCCRCIGGEGAVVNLNTGSGAGAVPWSVTGPGVTGTAFGQTINSGIHPLWTANLAPAQWIHPNNSNGADAQPGGTYNYTVRIVVPKCTIPMRVRVSGSAAGDDQIRVFFGSSITPIATTPTTPIGSAPTVPNGAGGWGFRSERIVNFTTPTFGTGTHLLRIEVTNGSAGPHGLLVRAAARAICSRALSPDQADDDAQSES